MDLGELRARLTAESTQIKAEIRAVKKDILDLGEQGKKAQAGFTGLNDSLSQIGLSSKQIEKINKELRSTNPQILEKQLTAVREELKKLGVESKQIDKIEKELGQAGDEAESTAKSVGNIETALVAVGANVALSKMLGVVGSLANEADVLGRSIRGLSEVSKAMNQDVDASTEAAQRLVDKGFMNIQEASEALKTTLATGNNIEESVNLITAIGDAAAYNREAHYEWGEAVVQAVRGIKQQNSTLTDAAGITTNLSVMYQRYADSIDKSVGTLTEAEKKQAAYNGMMQEATLFAGNAESAMEGYTGSNTMFTQTVAMARAELGESFLPVLQEIMDTLQPIIVDFAKWASENKEVVAGIAAGTIAVTALIAILTTLITVLAVVRTAMIALNIAMGPIGWAIAAISAIAVGLGAYALASDATSESVLKFAKNQEELNQRLKESPLNTTTNEVKQMQADIDVLNGFLEKRIALEDRLNEIMAYGERGEGTSALLSEGMDIGKQIREIDKALEDLDYDSVDEVTLAIKKMKEQLKLSVPAQLALQRAELDSIATQVQHTKQVTHLRDRFKELTSQEKLSADGKAELQSVIKSLQQEYPTFFALMDKEGKVIDDNITLVNGRIEAEETLTSEMADGATLRLKNMKAETEAQAGMILTQINNLKSLAKAQMLPPQSNALIDSFSPGTKSALSISDAYVNSMTGDKDKNAQTLSDKTKEYNEYLMQVTQIEKEISKIAAGDWDRITKVEAEKDKDKSKKGKESDPQQEAFNLEMKLIRYKTEMYNWSAEQQIEAFTNIQKKHQSYLKRSLDDEQAIQLQLKSLKDEIDHAKFDNSTKWIEKEKYFKRLSLDDELKAWERVQARYLKGSKEREQADREIFKVKQDIAKRELEQIKVLEEKQKDLQGEMKDFVSEQKKLVEDAKKAELKGIDDAKKAYVSAQDDKIRALDKLMAAEADANSDEDYAEELAKKNARATLLLNAVGPEGKKERRDLLAEIAEMEEEHAEELRKRDLEAQKEALQDDKRVQEDTFDEAKTAAESHYDDLIVALEDYQDDAQGVEVAIKNFRVATANNANTQILQDLDVFISDYKTKMAAITSLQGSIDKDTDWQKYLENQNTWNNPGSTNAQKLQANADNVALRDKYGVSQTDYGGLQQFKTGGVVKGGSFGQTIPVMAEVGEMFLNPSQQATLFELLDGVMSDVAGQSTTTNSQQIVNHFDLSVGEVHLEDDADIESMYEERENLMRRMQARAGVK